MTKTLTATVLTVLVLLLSACGSGSSGASAESKRDAKASKNISASIMKEQKSSKGGASQFFSMKQKDADCIGDGFVSKIGTAKLQKYGLLDKSLKTKDSVTDLKMASGDAKSATGVLFDCTNVEGMMRTAISKSGNVPAQMKTCVNKTLTDANLRPFFEKSFQGKAEQAQKDLVKPMTQCAMGSNGG